MQERPDDVARPAVVPHRLLTLRSTLVAVTVVSGLILIFVAALVWLTDRDFQFYSRDPSSTLGSSPLVGVLSNAGVLLTWGAAIVCVFAAFFVARARGWRVAVPLLVFGLGAAYLALDDFFVLHDDIYSRRIGIEQEGILLVYAGGALAFLWWFRDFFRQHEWPLLAAAMVTLSTAFILDFEEIHHHLIQNDEIKRWVEDSAKLVGLSLLAAYLVRLSVRMLAEAYPLPSRREPTGIAAPEPDSVSAGHGL